MLLCAYFGMQAGLFGSMLQSISQFDYSGPRPSSFVHRLSSFAFQAWRCLADKVSTGHFDFLILVFRLTL